MLHDDLTAGAIDGVSGPFDLLADYGTHGWPSLGICSTSQVERNSACLRTIHGARRAA
jgi:hypothetical protein